MGGQRRRARCTFGRDGLVRNASARGIRAAVSTGFTEENGVVDALDSLASADKRRRRDHGERWRTGFRSIRDLGYRVVQFALVRPGPAIPGLCRAGNRFFQPDCDRRSNLVVAWSGDQRRLHGVQQRAARDRTGVAYREHDDPGFCRDVGADHHGVHAGRRWHADRRPRSDAADQWRVADGNADDHGPKPVDHALGLYDPLQPRDLHAAGPATNPCEFGAGMGVDLWHTLAHRQSVDVRHRHAGAVRDEQLSERIFLGQRAAPSASSAGNFTLLGSVTPEGRVLSTRCRAACSPASMARPAAMRRARKCSSAPTI